MLTLRGYPEITLGTSVALLILSAYPLRLEAPYMFKKSQDRKFIQIRSHGRSMGHRGTDDPACQVEPAQRASS